MKKVYLLMADIPYEGLMFFGAFSSEEEANKALVEDEELSAYRKEDMLYVEIAKVHDTFEEYLK